MLGVELRLHGHCFVSGVMGSRGKGFLGRSCTKLGIAKGAIVLFFYTPGKRESLRWNKSTKEDIEKWREGERECTE